MRRIVSIDGGGIRGIFALQVLRTVEAHLRRDHSRESLVLADVVDFFAGTSTGAIIAACLSWGMSVDAIEQLYEGRGAAMFAGQPWYRRFRSKYRADSISQFFEGFFRESDGTPALLGTSKLRTLFLAVMRNASTGSAWPVSNNPAGKYNAPEHPDCNLRIPLWQLVRASTAAPLYFSPQEIAVDGQPRLFVDGGITPYNNPALIAILMATLPEYKVGWPAGRTNLHVLSIGTGSVRRTLPRKRGAQINLLDQLRFIAPALIGAASVEQDIICRVLGDCLFGAPIDTEIGDLGAPTLLSRAEQKFTYVRYDMALDSAEGPRMSATQTRLDNLASIPTLRAVGAEYAARAVLPHHLYARGQATPRAEVHTSASASLSEP